MSQQSFHQFDSLLSDRVRLSIMSLLSAHKRGVSFNEILTELELSRGNLSSHMKKLEDADMVEVVKEFVERKPKTTYFPTNKGRQELLQYLDLLEGFLKGAQNAPHKKN